MFEPGYFRNSGEIMKKLERQVTPKMYGQMVTQKGKKKRAPPSPTFCLTLNLIP